MAQSNKRYFNTFFFEDPYIENLDAETRLLYLTMILNPHNNLAGVYEISITKLSVYTALSEDKVRTGIQKLQEDKKILFSGNWLALKNFIKNNEFNANMCKNAFDIMKAAPKDKIVFIIADNAGNAEPWLDEFIEKVGHGINTAIDLKNRSITKKAKEAGEVPKLIEYVNFSVDNFMNEIMRAKNKLINDTITESLGNPSPSLTQGLGNHRGMVGEYKGEFESKREMEDKEEYINTDEPESTLPALTPTAEPNGSVIKKSKSIKIPEEDLPLYNNVKKYYEEQQDSKQFTNYPKEALAIKGLIEKSKIQAPDNHVEFLKMLTSVFKELRNIDPFYSKHPFLPSSLNSSGIFDRVLNEAQMKWKEKQEASAFDVSELY